MKEISNSKTFVKKINRKTVIEFFVNEIDRANEIHVIPLHNGWVIDIEVDLGIKYDNVRDAVLSAIGKNFNDCDIVLHNKDGVAVARNINADNMEYYISKVFPTKNQLKASNIMSTFNSGSAQVVLQNKQLTEIINVVTKNNRSSKSAVHPAFTRALSKNKRITASRYSFNVITHNTLTKSDPIVVELNKSSGEEKSYSKMRSRARGTTGKPKKSK